MEIDTGDTQPVNTPPYKTGPAQRAVVEEHINAMLKDNICQPSNSPWASPIVIVPKPGGKTRFCIDFRKLNKITKKDVYPLPRIDTLLDCFVGKCFFTIMDMLCGYWNVRMHDNSRQKTAFASHMGLFEFIVMPFGLTNAPAKFQRMMDCVLAGLKWIHCLVYIDDVVIFSKTFDEHIASIRKVWQRFRQCKLVIAPKKTFLCCPKVKFLGHIVSADGVSTDPDKTKAIDKFPTPTCKKDVKSFLGITGYYRKFICHFAARSAPLTTLTSDKIPFVWTSVQQAAFDDLKQALTSPPILKHPNFDYPFLVDTDACSTGLGAILMQNIDNNESVISYASRKLNEAEAKWCVRELEALAIIWACQLFRPYLFGAKFVVRTDHSSLVWLHRSQQGRLARWSLALQEFDFDIVYRPGKGNPHADALSRNPLNDKLFLHKAASLQDIQPADSFPPSSSNANLAFLKLTAYITALQNSSSNSQHKLHNFLNDTSLQCATTNCLLPDGTSFLRMINTNSALPFYPDIPLNVSSYIPDTFSLRKNVNQPKPLPTIDIPELSDTTRTESDWLTKYQEYAKRQWDADQLLISTALASRASLAACQNKCSLTKHLKLLLHSRDNNTRIQSQSTSTDDTAYTLRKRQPANSNNITNKHNIIMRNYANADMPDNATTADIRHIVNDDNNNNNYNVTQASSRDKRSATDTSFSLRKYTSLCDADCSQTCDNNDNNYMSTIDSLLRYLNLLYSQTSCLNLSCRDSQLESANFDDNNPSYHLPGTLASTHKIHDMSSEFDDQSVLTSTQTSTTASWSDQPSRSSPLLSPNSLSFSSSFPFSVSLSNPPPDIPPHREDAEDLLTSLPPTRILNRILPFLRVFNNALFFTVSSPKPTLKHLPVLPLQLQQPMVRLLHGNPTTLHQGINRTLSLLKKRVYWIGMHRTASLVINNCLLCQRQKTFTTPQPLHSLSLPKLYPWHTIALDFFGPLPSGNHNFKYVLVIIDHFTKWPEIFPTSDTSTATIVRHLYPLFLRFGCPHNLLTDNGTGFVSHTLTHLCQVMNINKLKITPYHPQGNGIAEAFMKVLSNQLAMLVNERHDNWPTFLPQLLFGYRSTPHPATGETPFYLLHGFDPTWPTDLLNQTSPTSDNLLQPLQPETYRYHISTMQQARLKAWYQLTETYYKHLPPPPQLALQKYQLGQLVTGARKTD